MSKQRIRDRQQWWDFATARGTDGSMVLDVITDWQKTDKEIVNTLTEIRDTARTGLPVGGMTEEQWAKHRLNAIASRLTRLIDSLE